MRCGVCDGIMKDGRDVSRHMWAVDCIMGRFRVYHPLIYVCLKCGHYEPVNLCYRERVEMIYERGVLVSSKVIDVLKMPKS